MDDVRSITNQARSYHLSEKDKWVEMCSGVVNIKRNPSGPGALIVFTKDNDPSYVVLGYRLCENTNARIDPSGLRIVWPDTSYRCDVAVAFTCHHSCQAAFQALSSVQHVEPISFSSKPVSREHVAAVVDTVSRNIAARGVEVVEELMRDDYWRKCLLCDDADSDVRVAFARQLLSLNHSGVITTIIDTPALLTAVLEALSLDKDVFGRAPAVDHVAVLTQRRSKFRNCFGLNEDTVASMHRLQTVLYVRECVLPQVLEDPALDSSAKLLIDARSRAVSSVVSDAAFSQGLAVLPAVQNVAEDKLMFVDALLQNARHLPEAAAAEPVELLIDKSFATTLYSALRTHSRTVSNILSSVEIISVKLLRRLLAAHLPQHNSTMLTALIRSTVDAASIRGASRLFSDIVVTSLDMSLPPRSPGEALDDASETVLHTLHGKGVIRTMFISLQKPNVMFMKLLEPCIRTHGNRIHTVMSTFRVAGVLDGWYMRPDASQELRVQVLRTIQTMVATRDAVLVQHVADSGFVQHVLLGVAPVPLRQFSSSLTRSPVAPSSPTATPTPSQRSSTAGGSQVDPRASTIVVSPASARRGLIENSIAAFFECVRKEGNGVLLGSLFSSMSDGERTEVLTSLQDSALGKNMLKLWQKHTNAQKRQQQNAAKKVKA
eukprot:PhM_4_TR16625/c0_g1_i1/m.9085